MLLISLLAGLAQAGQESEVLRAGATQPGVSTECGALRPVTVRAMVEREYGEDALNTIEPMVMHVTGMHTQCDIALNKVTFVIDGKQRWSRSLSLMGEGVVGGEAKFVRDSITMPPLKDVVLGKGTHVFEATLTGLVGTSKEELQITMDGTLTVWRDLDDDRDADDRLIGGTDCKDTDPDIYGGAPDYEDGKDNDCDGTEDNDDDEDDVNDALEMDWGLNPNEADTDGDGATDGVEWGDGEEPIDSDGDGKIDAAERDSDNDGRQDKDEFGNPAAPRDTDGDGLEDFRDDDDDNDGLPTKNELFGDYDGDGLEDYLDPDSDNDGALDGAEGTGDSDGDGLPNHRDTGSDLDDRQSPALPDKRGFGLGCSTSPLAPAAFLLLLPLIAVRRRT